MECLIMYIRVRELVLKWIRKLLKAKVKQSQHASPNEMCALFHRDMAITMAENVLEKVIRVWELKSKCIANIRLRQK